MFRFDLTEVSSRFCSEKLVEFVEVFDGANLYFFIQASQRQSPRCRMFAERGDDEQEEDDDEITAFD